MFFDFCSSNSKKQNTNDPINYIECLDTKSAEYDTVKRYLAITYGEVNKDRILKYIIEQKKDNLKFSDCYKDVVFVPTLFFGDMYEAVEIMLKNKIDNIKKEYLTVLRGTMNIEMSVFFCSSKILLIKPSIKYMQNLKVLQLCCNVITTLPEEITELQNLRKLSVPRNKIFILPKKIGNMSYLRDLNLSNNSLRELPPSFASLRRISFLSIFGNKFMSFPMEIIGCLELQYLHFGNNQIYKFPAELFTLPHIRVFEYDHQKVSAVPNKIRTPNIHCTLQEITARHVIKNALDIPLETAKNIKKFLRSVEECFYCGGPLFDFYYEVYKEKIYENRKILVYLKMCSNHISSINDINTVRFVTHPQNYPSKLIAKKYPRVRELFVASCYNFDKLKEIISYKNKSHKQKAPFFTLLDDYDAITIEYLQFLCKKEAQKRSNSATYFQY